MIPRGITALEILKKIKNKLKSSFKSVLLNFKEFVGIYVAIMIVQLLVGVWSLAAFTNYYANDSIFDNNYKYDVTIKGASSVISTLENRFRFDKTQSNTSIDSFGYSSDRRSLGVVLKDGQFDKFYDEYLEKLVYEDKVEYTLTPKYVYHSEIQSKIIGSTVIIGVTVFLISLLILSVMYAIRTNHYKFQYGLYMTFGADKKMLGSIALNELMAINTLTLVPSAIISYLLTVPIYWNSITKTRITFLAVVLYIAITYLVAFVAACISVGGLFIKPPISLITTADNSNFVSSPRRSFNIFAKKMPFNYELYTTWRFRKYIAKLVLGAVAFSVIFVTGIYGSNMLKTENDAPKNEFTISYKFNTMDEDLRLEANEQAEDIIRDISKIENIEKLVFEQSKAMNYRSDHILLKPGTEITGSKNTVVSNDEYAGYTRATNSCRYVCIDEITLFNYENLYSVEYLEGYDAQSVLEDDNMIVVSEELFGSKCFDFKPGDKIVIAKWLARQEQFGGETDRLKMLSQEIKNCTFTYQEYTIGAVINTDDSSDSIIVGMNSNGYYRTVGEKRNNTTIDVYVSSGLELGDVTRIREDVKLFMSKYSAWNVTVSNGAIYSIVDDNINLPGLLNVISILTLFIAPVVWIFSQVMFYKKREDEFDLLQAMGTTLKEIGGIHLVSGVLIFLISFIVNFALSRLLCFIIYRIFTAVLPNIGIMSMSVSFAEFVPVSTVLIYAAVSAVCGCISSLIPFLLYKRKLKLKEKALMEQTVEL